MTSHLLKDFPIYDVKGLSDLTFKGFKRINLITGKNNIGKTTFLETLFMNNKCTPRAVGFISDDAVEVVLEHPFHRSHLPIDTAGSLHNLSDMFDKLLRDGKGKELDNHISDFDSDITGFNFFGDGKAFAFQHDVMHDMTGKGFLQYVKIIFALYTCANGYLCIDDIANGIHYSQLDKLWETLFKLAIEHNIQIFSSTHNLEMIKAFAKAAKNSPAEAAYFEMARPPRTGVIKAVRHDISTLCFELDRNIGIRGE